MGKLHVCLAVAFIAGACGNDHADKVIDAPKAIDAAAPDAKDFKDAPIDAAPNYDFSCATNTPPTTAPADINVSGSTVTIGLGGSAAVGSATVAAYANGGTTPLVPAVMSDGTTGAYTLSTVPTGSVPLAGFIEATGPTGGTAYLTTFVYPTYPLAANTTGIETLMLSVTTYTELAMAAGVGSDSTDDGNLVVVMTDCAGTRIQGATLSVTTTTNTAMQVGTQFNLGTLPGAGSAGEGVFAVMNVPAGSVDVSATYGGHDLPATGPIQVVAYKSGQMGVTSNGSLTTTLVRPGPAN
jgi:hypothetical protein